MISTLSPRLFGAVRAAISCVQDNGTIERKRGAGIVFAGFIYVNQKSVREALSNLHPAMLQPCYNAIMRRSFGSNVCKEARDGSRRSE
jgi:hypothetical protein